ncbi:hypothetical protein [Metabacillus malikii]|uniref:Uncharacterized protein n=1 Tax=Metabacillus malikii TaxID=1504265 RepID=A0ABT9ZBZ7_9BACI|nr:hypothetical protein [Metabacillus malikii]MDQ0229444.1 hypothetical protein [Metabacillus malikii]
MKTRVIAVEKHDRSKKVYFLNEIEPKPLQLYMAILSDLSLNTLTIYNLDTNQFEDVTCMFHEQFLQNLASMLTKDFQSSTQSRAI